MEPIVKKEAEEGEPKPQREGVALTPKEVFDPQKYRGEDGWTTDLVPPKNAG